MPNEKPTDERIKSLPVWAQEYIKDISRERDDSISTLNKFIDAQTPTGIYYAERILTGEEKGPTYKRRYVSTNQILIENAGIVLDVSAKPETINLSWSSPDRLMDDIAFIPYAYQQARLVAPENMRSYRRKNES